MKRVLLAAVMLLLITAVPASATVQGYGHILSWLKYSKPSAPPAVASKQVFPCIATAVGVFVCATAVAVAWCGLNQPPRDYRRDTFVDDRQANASIANARPDGCIWRDPPKPPPISVRS